MKTLIYINKGVAAEKVRRGDRNVFLQLSATAKFQPYMIQKIV